MVQLPSAAIFAPLKCTDVAVFASDLCAPVQVVATAGVAAIVRLDGIVKSKLACVSAKPLLFASVMRSVEVPFSSTLSGEKDSLTVGAAGATVKAVGHAVARVPADVGAALEAEFARTVTVSSSVLPAVSVMVSVKVPGAGSMVTFGVSAPLTIRLDGDALQR